MHYTGFPSALHSLCLPTFSHLHSRFSTLGTFLTLCTHLRLKSIGRKKKTKNYKVLFQFFQSWTKGVCLMQSPRFLSLQGPLRSQSKTYIFSQPLLWYVLRYTSWNPQRGIWQSRTWIPLNTSPWEGMQPRAAPSLTTTECGVQAEWIWKSQL